MWLVSHNLLTSCCSEMDQRYEEFQRFRDYFGLAKLLTSGELHFSPQLDRETFKSLQWRFLADQSLFSASTGKAPTPDKQAMVPAVNRPPFKQRQMRFFPGYIPTCCAFCGSRDHLVNGPRGETRCPELLKEEN